MNHLPRAVREQFERSEALHQQLLAGNTAPVATPAEAPVTQAPVAVVPSEPAQPPAAVDAPTQAPVVAAPAPVEPVVDSWEHKYRVLQGKYNKDVRELREALQAAQAAPVPAPVATPGLTPEAVTSQYGEDFTNAVAAVAQDAVRQVQSRVDSVQEVVAQNARQTFLADLARLVPNFQAIDADARFTAYLDEIDLMSGRFRRELFQEADAGNDANRIAVFFRDFSRASVPAPQPQPAPAPVPAAPAAPPSVDHLLAPDSARHSEAPPGKKLWTRPEIAAFYRDAKHQAGKPFGKYTAVDYERISKDIDAAVQEGRIRG